MSAFHSLQKLNDLLSDFSEELVRIQDDSPETRLKLLQLYEMQGRVAGRMRAWLVHVPDSIPAMSADARAEQILSDLRQRLVSLKSRGPGSSRGLTRDYGDLFDDVERLFSVLGPPEGFPDDDPLPAPAPPRPRAR